MLNAPAAPDSATAPAGSGATDVDNDGDLDFSFGGLFIRNTIIETTISGDTCGFGDCLYRTTCIFNGVDCSGNADMLPGFADIDRDGDVDCAQVFYCNMLALGFVSIQRARAVLLVCAVGLVSPVVADDVIIGSFSWPDCGLRFYGCDKAPDDFAYVDALANHTDGKLYVGGQFQYVGDDLPSSCIAAWDGKAWQSLNSTPGGSVRSVLSAGGSLYIGGYFTTLSGIPASRIARWDGKTWHPLGVGTNGAVLALAATNEKDQPVLYAAGTFGGAGGQSAKRIARWDGASWSNLGTGLDNTALGLTTFDDGSGPAVYVCGPFHKAGGLDAHKVAKWDIRTKTWSPLGGGVTSQEDATSLAVFDDGNGPPYTWAAFSTRLTVNSPVKIRVSSKGD